MKTFALAYPLHFLSEQRWPQTNGIQFRVKLRPELYEQYCSGIAQPKNVHGAKRSLQRRALSGLGRSVA